MLYNLPSGKTIQLSIDEYLNLTEDEIRFLVAHDYGEYMNNPNSGSVLKDLSKEYEDDQEPEEVLMELDNTCLFDKIAEFDYEPDFD